MGKVRKVKDNHLVVISNQLLESCYTLSVVEKRVLWLLLSRLPANVDRNIDIPPVTAETWLTISVEDYMTLAETTLANAYVEVKGAAESLNDRVVTLKGIETPKSTERFHWVTGCTFIPETYTVKARLYPTIIPFLTNLREKFAQLDLSDAFGITSRYSWKLFDYFYKYKGTPCRVIELTIPEINNLLDIQEGDSYYLYKNLKSKILLPSVKELSDKWLCHINMEERKIGRKVMSIKFTFILEKKQLILANTARKPFFITEE